MKIKAIPTQQNFTHTIDGGNINGIPLSEIQDGESFSLPEMAAAGIRKAERIDGVLHVELEQACIAYRYPVSSHDWRESDWIDAASFDTAQCYCKPISVDGKVDWHFEWVDTTETLPTGVERPVQGWTVVQELPPEPEPEATEELEA